MPRKNVSAVNSLKSFISQSDKKILSVIDVSILPYQAAFIADPFIRYVDRVYHVLCEVFVCDGDKRIAHIRSGDAKTWEWVSDLIVGESISFPAIYGEGARVVIIPQLGGLAKMSFSAYEYNLVRPFEAARKIWSLETPWRMSDRLLIANANDELFVLFGKNEKRSSLAACKWSGSSDLAQMPLLDTALTIRSRGLREYLENKILGTPKTTHRPAGDLLYSDSECFSLPMQATIKGAYGECLAILTVMWQGFKVLNIEYILPSDFSPSFRRVHHLSWCRAEDRVIFCGDMMNDPQEMWKLFIFEAPLKV